MHSVEFLAAIKADREREIKATQRARLVRREPTESASDEPVSRDSDRTAGRMVRPSVQSGRTSSDPSL